MGIRRNRQFIDGSRPKLKEIEQNITRGTVHRDEDHRKNIQGTWKRQDRGERGEAMQITDQCIENFDETGIKRARQLGEIEDAQLLHEGLGNRNKWQKIDQSENSPMVGVASQKWPQMDR